MAVLLVVCTIIQLTRMGRSQAATASGSMIPQCTFFFKKKKKTVSRTLPVRESIQFIGESYCGRGIPEREGFRRLVCLIFSSFNLPTRDHVGCSTTNSHFSPLFPDVYLK